MHNVLFENTYDLVVADSETLSRWDDAIMLSIAMTHGDLRKPYTVEQLVEERTFFMKFDSVEQAKLGRKTEPHTVNWWKSDKVCEEARKVSFYTDKARDESIRDFARKYTAWAHILGFDPYNTIHADRNLFDMRKLQHIINVTLGEEHHPWHYHDVEDISTRMKSYTGDRYGNIDIRKLEGAVYHDPRWDAAVDWYRTQQVGVQLGLVELEEI